MGVGVHINSGFLDGLGKQEAIDTMIDWLTNKGVGKRQVNYRLREWIFARQRYWGEPIPIVHYDDHDDVFFVQAVPIVDILVPIARNLDLHHHILHVHLLLVVDTF